MRRGLTIVLTCAILLTGDVGWDDRRIGCAARLVAAAEKGDESSGLLRERSSRESITTEVNAKAPAFASVVLDERLSSLRSIDFIGQKVLLLAFWSVFCGSCIQEMPFMDQLYRKYQSQGLQVVGINTDFFGPERIRRFMARLEPTPVYPIIHDQDQSISRSFNVEALPVTVLIDSFGVIRMYHLGFKPSDRGTIENSVRRWTKQIRESVETVAPVDGKTPISPDHPPTLEGKTLPWMTLMDSEGKRFTLSKYRDGRPMILFFWSLFCQPCREEMKVLSRESKRLSRENGIVFLSVNLDADRLKEQVVKFLARKPFDFPTAIDSGSNPPGAAAQKLGVSYTPTLIMVKPEGVVQKVLVGGRASGNLEARLSEFAKSLTKTRR